MTERASLAGLPFREQVEQIEALLQEPAQAAGLLAVVGSFRDVEPLAYLVARLAQEGLLSHPDEALGVALRVALTSASDAGVARLLRRVERAGIEAPPALVSAVGEALRLLPLHRLAAICFFDRWLKNHAPEAREALCTKAFEECAAQLREGLLDELPDGKLLLLSGVQLAALEEQAAAAGRLDALQARLARFSQRVLEVLEAAPKSISQANAEELLSRRVYTDPTHFFFELLQNAEDAGATRWRVEVRERALWLWHDGVSFDAKDVVGVLSIGQTTKRRGQIGFFGVGFKAVYEVTDRPQLYSGPFSFEIADISMPRKLAARPPGAPDGGTLLVLPLRPEDAAQRPPALLFSRLRELPAEVLLTLGRLRALSFSSGGDERRLSRGTPEEEAAAPTAGRLYPRPVPGGELRPGASPLVSTQRLSDLPGRGEVSYLSAWVRARYEGRREAGRAAETPILVAMALDSAGLPAPLPEGAPEVFCYLPTKERPGLRVVLHAHFDLPVDRERIDATTPWNRWILSQAGALWGALFGHLCEQPGPAGDAALTAAVALLPLPGELRDPAYLPLWDALRSSLQRRAILVGAAGERLCPSEAALLFDARVAPFLAGLALDADGRRALGPLDERGRVVASAFGAAHVSSTDFVDWLGRCFAAEVPAGLRSRDFLDCLGALGLRAHAEALRGIPLLPDERGALGLARDRARATDELRALYGDWRPFLARDLDQSPTPAEEALLRLLACPRLEVAALLHDLRDPSFVAHVPKDARLFSLLAPQADAALVGLASLPLFVDREGRARPLTGTERVYLWPEGPLRAWLEGVTGLPLVAPAVQEQARGLLARLGAEVFDLAALLGRLSGGLILGAAELRGLHMALEAMQDDLSPRLAERLGRAPLFSTTTGKERPLLGPGAALLGDAELRAVAPGAPWVVPALAKLTYLSRLGASLRGAEDVALALLGEETGLGRPVAAAAVRYLSTRGAGVSAGTRERLAAASLWRDTTGAASTLAALRLPPQEPALVALYRAWPIARMIEEGPGSSLALAEGLGLAPRLAHTDYAQLLHDLAGQAPPEEARGALVTALCEAAQALPARALAPLVRAPLWRARSGEVGLSLASWEAREQAGVRRAPEALSPVFAGATLLLHPEDEEALAPVLALLPVAPAGLAEVLSWAEAGLLTAAGVAAARGVLREQREALRALRLSPARLAELPLWPTRAGQLAPARAVILPGELARALGPRFEDALPAEVAAALIAPSAEEDAEALAESFSFQAPIELLRTHLVAGAKLGAPLSEQPGALGSLAGVGRLLALFARHLPAHALAELPLSVDARGCLVRGRRFRAEPDEALLAAPLPLYAELGDPAWVRMLRASVPDAHAEALAPPLDARRLVAALAEAHRAPQALSQSAFAEEPRRHALYRWLLARSEAIAADETARGMFGKACVLATAGAQLRAPRELILDDTLPDVGLDWSPAPELPAPLLAWLRTTYRLEERRLAQIVSRILDAHQEAASAKDLARSVLLLRALAGALQAAPEPLEALAERSSFGRHLKVADTAGEFQKVRRLLAPTPERWELLCEACEQPPARLSPAYDEPGLRDTLRAAGAPSDLAPDDLAPLLRGEGRRPGLTAALALARYVSLVLLEQPAAQQALQLNQSAWIPDGTGQPRPPSALYWPTPEALSLLGEEPALYPHPEVALTVPAAITERLRFRRVEEAPLEDLLARVREDQPAPPELLRWLEEGLRTRRVEAAAIRRAFSGRALLPDEEGTLRPPEDLLRVPARELFGQRRGYFSAWRRLPLLSDALGIPQQLGPREFASFYAELADDLQRHGGELLAQEPELLACLLRLLSRLAERAQRPDARPVEPSVLVAEDAAGRYCLAPLREPRLRLPSPPEAVEDARRARRYLLVVLPSEATEEALQLLGTWIAPLAHAAPAPSLHPEPSTEATVLAPQVPARPEEPRPGLFARLRRWAQGGEESPTASPPTTPGPSSSTPAPEPPGESAARPHQEWFRPRTSVEPQLRAANAWLDDRARAPRFGFSFSPRDLPLPYRYGVQLLASRLDPRSQRWLPGAASLAWAAPEGAEVGQVALRGRLPAGESQVPLPLYASLSACTASVPVRQYVSRTGQRVASLDEDAEVELVLSLHAPPRFLDGEAPTAPAELLARTVPDDELPAELLSWLETLRELPARTRAVEIREMIRERYRYDPSYLEDEGVARWLRGVTQGRANVHLAALHAWRDAQHLGRGVCYELNALACELLRRAGIPAAIATGWTFDRGSLGEPDHLWAMALLPAEEGPRWFPIDAATTRDGRPLRVAQRPPGRWTAPRRPSIGAPESLSWDRAAGRGPREAAPSAELLRVLRYLSARAEVPLAEEVLRRRCQVLLRDPARAKQLLDLLAE